MLYLNINIEAQIPLELGGLLLLVAMKLELGGSKLDIWGF